MMDPFEDELRQALRREEAPEGFAERVLAAARAPTPPPRAGVWNWFRLPAVRWVLVGAGCLALAAGLAVERRERATRARGEAARAQLMLALRITRGELERVQAKVSRIGADTRPSAPQRVLEKRL